MYYLPELSPKVKLAEMYPLFAFARLEMRMASESLLRNWVWWSLVSSHYSGFRNPMVFVLFLPIRDSGQGPSFPYWRQRVRLDGILELRQEQREISLRKKSEPGPDCQLCCPLEPRKNCGRSERERRQTKEACWGKSTIGAIVPIVANCWETEEHSGRSDKSKIKTEHWRWGRHFVFLEIGQWYIKKVSEGGRDKRGYSWL